MEKQYLLHIPSVCLFKEIYCKESMYSMFKYKLQNCSHNQFEYIFAEWHKWYRNEYSYLLTYSMVQSPSWEANWFAASQEIPRISWNPKVH